ncbi:hypothetical protein KI387_036826, partial [Taxus chinensis]
DGGGGWKQARKIKCIRASAASSPTKLESTRHGMHKAGEVVRVGVLGASGYTGSEIVRLLATHPYFNITLMTADRKAGQVDETPNQL